MTLALILTLLGLALVDSINTSTIWLVIAILLTAPKPVSTGWAYAAGAIIPFYIFSVALFLGATVAGSAFDGIADVLRSILFTVLAVFLVVLGIRRFKTRKRREMKLPKWITPATVFPLGLAATAADLPNAFPLFIAIERLADANIAPALGIPVLAVYTLIYALPTLTILILGIRYRDRVLTWLKHKMEKYMKGDVKASWKMSLLYFAGAAASISLVFILR